MAGDRVLRVVLVGNSGSAVKALGETDAAASTLGSKFKSVASGFKSVGTTLTGAGRKITHSVTLPVVAAAAASVDMATKFNAAMTRIQTQAGASAADVKKLSAQVLAMGGKVQQGPLDLANSLYHLKSVGMSNVTAMKALRASSKLAAVGNASLEDTTNALAGAWRTGISGAKNFHKEIATVNAIIGAGNMTLSDFNAALGTGILPTAKTFGLKLKDVGSALALFTDEGVNSASAGTRLRMSLSLLGAPSTAAEKVLDGIGLSGHKLGETLRKPNGLIQTISLLKSHLEGVGQYYPNPAKAEGVLANLKAKVSPLLGKSNLSKTQSAMVNRYNQAKNGLVQSPGKLDPAEQAAVLSRAFGGGKSGGTIMSLVNNLDTLEKKQRQVSGSMGKFGKAVAAQAKTPQAQFHLLVSTLETLGVKLGNFLLPIVVKMAQKFNGFLTWISKLNPQAKHMIGIFVGVVAAAGPLLMILGTMATAIAALATPVGLVVLAVVALAAAFAYAYTHSAKFRAVMNDAFGKIKPQIAQVVAMFKGQLLPALAKLLPILEPVAKFLGGVLLGAVVGAISGVVQVLKGAIQVIAGVINLVDDLIHGRWSQAWHDLVSIVKGIFNILIGAFKVWWNVGIINLFRHGLVSLLEVFGKGWKALIRPAEEGVSKLGRIMKGVINLITWPYRKAFSVALDFVETGWKYITGRFSGGVGGIKGILGRLVEVVTYPYRTAFDIAKGIVSKGVTAILKFFHDIPGSIKRLFAGASTWLVNAGKQIIAGLASGIKAAVKTAVDAAKGAAGSVIKAAKSAFHINSPSRVFHDIGVGLMEGLGNGVNAERASVVKAMRDTAAEMVREFGAKLNDPRAIGTAIGRFRSLIGNEIQNTRSKLQSLVGNRNSIASGISGIQQSVFGNAADTNGATSPEAILTFAKTQEDQAKKLGKAIHKLTKEGLSKSLIQQFSNSGDAGLAQLFALAGGPRSTIRQLNSVDKATTRLYGRAGMSAGNYIYGKAIAHEKRELHVEVKVASMIGEKDFAKKITPIIREELARVGKLNQGHIFGKSNSSTTSGRRRHGG